MSAQVTEPTAHGAASFAVELLNVSKGFATPTGDEIEALSGLTLDIRHGEFHAIVGPTGCGKSTTLTLVAGLDHPTAGEIRTLGQPVLGVNPAVGYMFQSDALFPWKTVRDNVAAGLRFRGVSRSEAREHAQEWISRVGLGGFERYYPSQLSGGMRKRTSMAQCLITAPQVMLMDEPFVALDVQTRALMEDELLNLWSATSATVVFVTHDLEEAIALADRVTVFTARPARLKSTFDIPLGRPRTVADIRTSPEFNRVYKEVWASLRSEVMQSYERQRNG